MSFAHAHYSSGALESDWRWKLDSQHGNRLSLSLQKANYLKFCYKLIPSDRMKDGLMASVGGRL